MEQKRSPKLRTVEKVRPPYLLNDFPKEFGFNLGKEIVYLLAVKNKVSLEGSEWEEIFANCIGANWRPSNVGLDDVILSSCAWGAKTVKAKNPFEQKSVRLISGRNSPIYSFGETKTSDVEPQKLGNQILEIWNERVSGIRKLFKHVRTVVLIKSEDLSSVVVFEFDTIRYETELYNWKWNTNGNLEGFEKTKNTHRFTWQPHGSQFTIIESVPQRRLLIQIKMPEKLDKQKVLEDLGFNNSWITVTQKDG